MWWAFPKASFRTVQNLATRSGTRKGSPPVMLVPRAPIIRASARKSSGPSTGRSFAKARSRPALSSESGQYQHSRWQRPVTKRTNLAPSRQSSHPRAAPPLEDTGIHRLGEAPGHKLPPEGLEEPAQARAPRLPEEGEVHQLEEPLRVRSAPGRHLVHPVVDGLRRPGRQGLHELEVGGEGLDVLLGKVPDLEGEPLLHRKPHRLGGIFPDPDPDPP